MKKYFLMAAMAVMSLAANAQLHFSLGAETAHLWRGYEVSNGLISDADLSFSAGGFKIGAWGGMSVSSNEYREFDYYAQYSANGLTVSVWDIYNTANDPNPGTNIFKYDKHSTGHFIDAGLAYNFAATCNVPLTLSWNTIIAGCDLDPADKDTQQYSTYVQAGYTVYDDENWTVTPSVGATFKFAGDSDTNFYGGSHKAGINDVRLATTYKLNVGNHPMPVTATLMWNPELKKGYMGVSVNLISF